MKKLILVLFIFTSSILLAETRQSEKVAYGIAGTVKLGLGYWGLTQKTTYGNVTGVMFSISGLCDFYNALK